MLRSSYRCALCMQITSVMSSQHTVLCPSVLHMSKVCLAVGQHSHMAGLQHLSAGCALLLAELCCRSAHCILHFVVITEAIDEVCMQAVVASLCSVTEVRLQQSRQQPHIACHAACMCRLDVPCPLDMLQ